MIIVDSRADGVHLRISRNHFRRIVRALREQTDAEARYLLEDLEREAITQYPLACQGEGDPHPGGCGRPDGHPPHVYG